MSYLITQTFILLLLAALLGLVLGWYLTRISAAAGRASLHARLKSAEADARELRGELDRAVNARASCEAERKAVVDELAALKAQPAASADPVPVTAAAPQGLVDVAGALPPARLDPGQGEADDLQRIKGIGPKIAGILRELGIVRFEQIADWTPENVAWVNAHLQFKGRIEREEWIPQARALIAARGE